MISNPNLLCHDCNAVSLMEQDLSRPEYVKNLLQFVPFSDHLFPYFFDILSHIVFGRQVTAQSITKSGRFDYRQTILRRYNGNQ